VTEIDCDVCDKRTAFFETFFNMPTSFTQPSILSYPSPNDSLPSCSGLYSYDSSCDSSFGMDSPGDFLPGPGPSHQPSIDGQLNLPGFPLGSSPDPSNDPVLYQIPSSTPIVRRIASYRHYLPSAAPKRGNVGAREMGTYLAIELNRLKPTKVVDLPNVVFPDSCLPFVVNEELLRKLKVWKPRKKILVPPAAFTEAAIQEWFNTIAKQISSSNKTKVKQCWSANFCNTVIPHSELQRKPDVILIKNALTPLDWRSVHAVTEVTSRTTVHTEMMKTINNKTYLMFSTQHSRRFVPFLAVCGPKIFFFVTDREGQTVSEICYEQPGEYHALNLIRIIVALTFGDDEIIGLDPTVTINSDGVIKTISSGNKVYAVKSTIHVVRGIIGRSTRVWSAYDNDKKLCIIKDGWIQEGRADAERRHLEQLKDIEGVPTLLWGGTVKIRDHKNKEKFCDDNTAWIRHGFSDKSVYRLHRRLILSPVGQNLATFTSLGELVAALRDVAVGMFTTFF
jgi:hypothetical protein